MISELKNYKNRSWSVYSAFVLLPIFHCSSIGIGKIVCYLELSHSHSNGLAGKYSTYSNKFKYLFNQLKEFFQLSTFLWTTSTVNNLKCWVENVIFIKTVFINKKHMIEHIIIFNPICSTGWSDDCTYWSRRLHLWTDPSLTGMVQVPITIF